MTRTLTIYGATGCLLLLFACGSESSEGGNPTATGSGGSTSTGTGGVAGTNGSGTSGSAGRGGSNTGGAGTGGAGAGGTGVAGSTGSGGSASGSGGSAGARDSGSTGGTAGAPGMDASRDTSTDAGTPGADASRDASADPGTPGSDAGRDASVDVATSNFSFFVASLKSLQTLSGKTEGFGGDFTFGQANGLAGADEVCRQTAELGMSGAGSKSWRAFLSATQGPGGTAVNARDRIGTGPWYDRNGRLLAASLTDLFAGPRPVGGDPMLVNDFTNERGEPNHYVGPGGYTPGSTFDDHDTLTGSDTMGMLRATSMADTCNDWTSATVTGRPWAGHSWPRSASSGQQWASDHQVPGCIPGLDKTLGGTGSGACVGCAGGYGGIFCFALP
jgi:hypothetical protein